MKGPILTFFESYNARALTPHQVAATFVPSSQFHELCQRCHSIVLGPRGSGKTTLLKMLQPAAIEAWGHASADDVATHIDFTGIFVATDISWSEQLASLGCGQLEDSAKRSLANASFTTHALRSLVLAFQQRCRPSKVEDIRRFKPVAIGREAEAEIVTTIAAAWHVEGAASTLFSLRQSLTQRLSQIKEIANQEMLMGSDGRAERLAKQRDLHLHFLEASAVAIEAFEHHAGLQAGKWAYLFDELELAPDWIQEELVRALRSTDDRFLFKLALNPFSRNSQLLQNPLSPAPGQDFSQIPLWYAEKRDAYEFCLNLWDELLKKTPLAGRRPVDVLGRSYFESYPQGPASSVSAYGPGSKWASKFASLAKIDPTFTDYLRKHSIDLRNLDLKQGADRAAQVRKVAPIIAVREFYLKATRDSESEVQLRGRKTAALYAGADSVFAITEGNPRWFIGLIGRWIAADGAGPKQIPPPRQGKELMDAAQRFTATLRTIPAQGASGVSKMSVTQLIRLVGKHFHSEAVLGPFRPEPPGSFTVDSKAPAHVLDALEQALNVGAVVYVPDDDGQLILMSLKGKRFRLSYLLAPLYGFPIRLGKDVALSVILRKSESPERATQATLLDFEPEAELD